MKIAIIHVRDDSSRIPNRNIKNFCGKSILAYPIEAALKSELFDRVIVNTDSFNIADIAKKYGAEVPYMRSAEQTGDFTTTEETLVHDISNLNNPDVICCIYPSPFITVESLSKGLKLLEENDDTTTVFPVTSFPFPILRSLKMNDKQEPEMFWPEHRTTRSQDLEPAYHDAGQFYWTKTKPFLQNPSLYANSKAIILPHYLVQNIFTPEDWEQAEYMYKAIS